MRPNPPDEREPRRGKDPRIEHIVVLMLENRSFDHMLGFLKREIPDLKGVAIGDCPNPGTGGPYAVLDGATYNGLVLLKDGGHEFKDAMQQMYDSNYGQMPNTTEAPEMKGFVHAYERLLAPQPEEIMRCFLPSQLPILTGLARTYTICDQWFSSVPGPTNPNRAFAHLGTSLGILKDGVAYRPPPRASIFERLGPARSTIYCHGFLGNSMTTFFLNLGYYRQFETDFEDDCRAGRLPEYTLIEPLYKKDGSTAANDQHPGNDVQPGEALIHTVYKALRENADLWKHTVLLLVWDEHGGTFDHVAPPLAPRDPRVDNAANGFRFDRYGVRVPAVRISAYEVSGTPDHTLYDHASIAATVSVQFLDGVAPYARERQANCFLPCPEVGPSSDWPAFYVEPGTMPELSQHDRALLEGFSEAIGPNMPSELSALKVRATTSKRLVDLEAFVNAARLHVAAPSSKK